MDTHRRVPLTLQYDAAGEPLRLICERCGTTSTFDVGLPFVNQVASFMTGHVCQHVIVLPDVTSV